MRNGKGTSIWSVLWGHLMPGQTDLQGPEDACGRGTAPRLGPRAGGTALEAERREGQLQALRQGWEEMGQSAAEAAPIIQGHPSSKATLTPRDGAGEAPVALC